MRNSSICVMEVSIYRKQFAKTVETPYAGLP